MQTERAARSTQPANQTALRPTTRPDPPPARAPGGRRERPARPAPPTWRIPTDPLPV